MMSLEKSGLKQMTTTRNQYWVITSGHISPHAENLNKASHVISQSPGSGCLAIETTKHVLPESEITNWKNQLIERHQYLNYLLHIEENPQQDINREFSIDVGADGEVVLYGLISSPLLCLLSLQSLDTGNLSTESAIEAGVRQVEASIIEKQTMSNSTDLPSMFREVSEFSRRLAPIQAAQQQASWTIQARDFIINSDLEGIRNFIATLVQRRAEWAQVLRFADQLGDARSRKVSSEALNTIDGLNTSLASLLTAELIRTAQESSRQERAIQTKLSEANRARDYRIARWLAAAVFPTLWLTYWATKPAPDISGLWPNIAVILVSIILAPIAFTLVGQAVERYSGKGRE
ncbi:hypothetical protein E7Z53_19550 [Kocuria salina]|uniref:hypothetical protein n=1 Tax=Kocuria salina TaxID=1929416 RepID=UPI00159391EF|nr:hypothetical protein [Kocuria salina]NVC25608.1 hypothetical protein [Kocuria salina]